jgi:hypothetical protein
MKFATLLFVAALGCDEEPTTMARDLAVLPDQGAPICAPGLLGNFMPTYQPPTGAHQNKCTPTQIADGVTALLGGSFPTFQVANAACAACLVSDSQAAMLGPVLSYGSLKVLRGNAEGCLALWTGDDSPSGCASRAQAQFQCALAVCGPPYCPIKLNRLFEYPMDQCWQEVMDENKNGACASYADATGLCRSEVMKDGGGDLNECFLQFQTETEYFTYLATLFCGA